MKQYGIIYRLIASPFVFLLTLITALIQVFITTSYFIRFGGEWQTYKSQKEKQSIADIFQLLQDQHKTQKLTKITKQ